MNIGEIFGDSLGYPFRNIKALLLYVILGIIVGLLGGTTILTTALAMFSKGALSFTFAGLGIVGLIVTIIVALLIDGYALDIVKFGIERREDGPGIDIGRQVVNAIKLVIVDIVYYVVPIIIAIVLGLFLRNWIMIIISIILFFVFTFADLMAHCRLAKTDSLGDALAIGEAIGDIGRVGVGKLIISLILIAIILFIIALIVAFLITINSTIGAIVFGIAAVYYVFFYNRVIGLLYSDV